MSKQKSKALPVNSNHGMLFKVLLAIIILFIYGQTLRFGFVLDDDLYIVKNPVIQNGLGYIPQTFFHGISEHFKGSNFMGYRPVTLSLFIIEYTLFGMNPSAFHFISLLLYFFVAIQLYSFLKSILPNYHPNYPASIVLLFLLHPIHTEVVANIKSQDELLSALFSLMSLNYFIRWSLTQDKRQLLFSCIAFLGALFSKESTIAYLMIFPTLLWLIFDRSMLNSIKHSIGIFTMGAVFLGMRFIALRGVVQGYETSARENILYAAKTTEEIWATKLEILYHYFLKSIAPYHLSWDYSFNQIPVINFSSYIPIVSLLVIIGLIILFFKSIKSNNVVAFSIVWFAVLLAPTCNFFILNGTTFGERFLFMPVLGVVLLLILGVKRLWHLESAPSPLKNNKKVLVAYVLIGVVCFSGSITRAADWKDNLTLFQSGVICSPNSARTNVALATEYMNNAEQELSPINRNTLVDSALVYFYKTVAIDTAFSDAWYKLGLIHAIKSDNPKAITYYREAIKYNGKNVFALNNLGALYVSLQKPDSAFFFFEKSYQAEPKNEMTLTNLTIVCSLLNKNEAVIQYGKKSINYQLANKKVYLNMAEACRRLNHLEEANKYQELSNTIN
ncbi:MAG: hypothetical protein ACKOX3_03735 [Bacteroidota bacterium]